MALAPTLLETSAQGRFGTENPGAPLPLRAGMEAEDAITVVCRDYCDLTGATDRESAIDVVTKRRRR